MSTAPSEAHRSLVAMTLRTFELLGIESAAQLLADSEARAVEAALHGASVDGLTLCGCKDHTHRKDLSCCKIRRSDGTPLTVAETFAALTAARERARVLEEANTWQDKSNAPIERTRVLATYLGVYEPCVGSISDSRFYPDGQSGSEPFTHWMPLPTLAATAEHAKEGSV